MMNSQTVSPKSVNFPHTLLAWIVCLCAGLFFAYELMQFHMLNAISPMLMKDFNMSAASFGVLGSTYLLADVIFLLPAGMLLDRFSPRKIILAALFICLLGTVGFALSNTLLQACVSHFLSGIGNAFCFLSCMMFISRWFPLHKQAFVVGVIVTLGMLGGVIAQAPFSYLAQAVTWRHAVLIDAALGSLLFVLIFCIVKDAPHPVSPEKSSAHKSLAFFTELRYCMLNRQNILCGLYTALTNLPLMVIGAAWGSLFLAQVHRIALSDASFIAGMICMGTIIGSSLCGFLSDYLGRRKPLMLLGALTSLGIMLLIILAQETSVLKMTLLFFFLGFFSSTQVLGYPLISERSPKHLTGTSMSVAAVIIMGLAGVVQFISGKLIDLKWDGLMIDSAPFYQSTDFMRCFILFPIGFIVSSVILFWIKESVKVKKVA
jgi:MFS family permease